MPFRLERQRFTWRELVGKPIRKLDDGAFTRMRVILLNGIEAEALRFGHNAARLSSLTHSLQAALAAELLDRDGWELLITMADELGERDMVARDDAAPDRQRRFPLSIA